MIKNRSQLQNGLSPEIKKQRKIALDIIDYTLEQIAPAKLFSRIIFNKEIKKSLARGSKKFEKIAVISIGKAAKEMAQAVIKKLPRKPDYLLFADSGHPLPSKQGVEKTEKIISAGRSLGEKDLAIVLISGGGSAMLASPVQGISLQDKIKTGKELLQCGATINEMNIVRKHLSQVKGGRLAMFLYPATVLGFVISDVVGNDLSTISSSPISPDKSTFSDAIKIIKKYRVKAPASVMRYLKKGVKNKTLETPKRGEKYFEKVQIKIVADHNTVLQKAARKAEKIGLKPLVIKKLITGEARKAAKRVIARPALRRPGYALIAAGETTVTIKRKNRGFGAGIRIEQKFGGRNQEFVLSGLRRLKPHQTLVSIGTDGVDGICPEPVAGAIGDSAILEAAKKQKLQPLDFLKKNNSYAFFKKTKGHIKTGPTGTNIGDLMMLIDFSNS